MVSNKDYLIYIRNLIKERERKELKKKLKENYYDGRLNNESTKHNGR